MPVKSDAVGKRWPAVTYEVGVEKIREFADAIDAPNPVHRDRDAAKAAGFRDLVAPPMFCVVYSARAMGPAILDPEVGINLATMLHGSQEFEWEEPDRQLHGDLREGRHGLLRLRDGLDQPGRTADRKGSLDQHSQGGVLMKRVRPPTSDGSRWRAPSHNRRPLA
jgi:N-terminal half of MaoC dehydratase